MYIDDTCTLLSCFHTKRSEEVLFVASRTVCHHVILEIRIIRKTIAACGQRQLKKYSKSTRSCADSNLAPLILNRTLIFHIRVSPLSLVSVACCALSNIDRAATSTDYKERPEQRNTKKAPYLVPAPPNSWTLRITWITKTAVPSASAFNKNTVRYLIHIKAVRQYVHISDEQYQ